MSGTGALLRRDRRERILRGAAVGEVGATLPDVPAVVAKPVDEFFHL
jgi:hypothetical protein